MSNFQQKEFVIPSIDGGELSPNSSRTSSREQTLTLRQQGSTYQSSVGSNEARSPRFPGLSNLNFLKAASEKKTTKEGQAPKRRGPKPDSKPALNRRQELNRQAQRTHRERKEHYIDALEKEVQRLKENFTTTVHEKNAYANENRMLKELLSINGINYHTSTQSPDRQNDVLANRDHASSSFNGSRSYLPSISPDNTTMSLFNPPSRQDSADASSNGFNQAMNTSAPTLSPPDSIGNVHVPAGHNEPPDRGNTFPGVPGVDYDQAGIDFVLALEDSCKDHAQFMVERSMKSEGREISGHALMATCPPPAYVVQNPLPQGYTLGEIIEPVNHMDMPKADLIKLFDLSQALPLDGEITPVMALKLVRLDPRYAMLSTQDLDSLREDLKGKSRCYGFGAVLEEFEVRDAMDHVWASKYDGSRAGF